MAQHIINNSGEKSPAIYTSKKWKDFYQALCTNRNNTDGLNMPIFDKYTNLYTLCCVIGFKKNKRTPLETKESLFTLEQIDENDEWPVLLSIAWLSGIKDLSVFANTKEMLNVCSEYAETGIEILANMYPMNSLFKDGQLITNKEPDDFKYDLITAISALKNDYLEEII